jgi:hypothetical protein
MTSVTRFLTRRLKLKVNEAKSAVARPAERKFLGFSFRYNKAPKRRIAPKALLRCKQKILELTRRTRGIRLSDTRAAENSGGMDTTSVAIHDLETVETREAAVREAASSRDRSGPRRTNGG